MIIIPIIEMSLPLWQTIHGVQKSGKDLDRRFRLTQLQIQCSQAADKTKPHVSGGAAKVGSQGGMGLVVVRRQPMAVGGAEALKI